MKEKKESSQLIQTFLLFLFQLCLVISFLQISNLSLYIFSPSLPYLSTPLTTTTGNRSSPLSLHSPTYNVTSSSSSYKSLVPKAMQRLPAKLCRNVVRPAIDVFINHRGIDTKKNVAGLIYHHLSGMGVPSFLDSMNMKPGDRLFDHIDKAILGCKVGVAVFSPRYCDSYFCLHELALLMESKKRVVPIFFDVKPSQLQVRDNGTCPAKELQRFRYALEEAKYTVGLTFDPVTGDWSELLKDASEAVITNLIEVEEERKRRR